MKSFKTGAILAGGVGKRLKPLTDNIPKPLIEIKDGYTILDKQLAQFKYAGIEKVVLLVAYKHGEIEKKYGKKWNDLKIDYLVEEKPMGTCGAFYNLFGKIDEPVIVRNGDIVSDVNLKQMIREHRNKMSMFLVPLQSPFGIVEKSADGKISNFREKPILNEHKINAGVYCIDSSLADFFLEEKEGDVEETVFRKIAERGFMGSYEESLGFWKSIDSFKDLETVRKEYSNKTDKPWGYEKLIVLNSGKYMTKELYIMRGEGTSYHYHPRKEESLHVTKGKCKIKFKDEVIILGENDTFTVKPKQEHSIIAIENTALQEYSTPFLEDTVRVNDPYKR